MSESPHNTETKKTVYIYSKLMLDAGGRVLLVHLDVGETVDLICNKCEAGKADHLARATFCISLMNFEV